MTRRRPSAPARAAGGALAAGGMWVVAFLATTFVPVRALAADLPEPVFESLETALVVYEEVRGSLAADRTEGLLVTATRLAGTLRHALSSPGLEGEIPDVILEAAIQAEAIAEAEDLTAARSAFGELSHRLMVLAEHDPRLAEGRHAFVCPMAPTFQKWIQPTEALDNPYMGLAMATCGSASDWAVPALDRLAIAEAPAEPVASPVEARRAASPEPEFKPGIPGLTMVDVRDHKFLWREIEELQAWEQGDRLTVAELRSKAIEKTAHFLGLHGADADAFSAAASAEIVKIRMAFHNRQAVAGTAGLEGPFSDQLAAAVTRLTAVLEQDRPRHRLFAPETKKWLLKLAFGPKESKEAREAQQARLD